MLNVLPSQRRRLTRDLRLTGCACCRTLLCDQTRCAQLVQDDDASQQHDDRQGPVHDQLEQGLRETDARDQAGEPTAGLRLLRLLEDRAQPRLEPRPPGGAAAVNTATLSKD